MKINSFAITPTVSISRSKFNRKSQHKTSFKLGEIVPIYCDEVLPGDTRVIDMASLIRMSNPIAPVMDNIYVDYFAYFVPNRLTWKHWKEFMGENNSSAGIYSGTEYLIPQVDIAKSGISVGNIGDHLGLPLMTANNSKSLKVTALPIRGLKLIYNRFFRDQNLIAPMVVNTGDTTDVNDSYDVACFKAAKSSDYFTRALPYVQKGAPVTIPMGTLAPVITGNTHDLLENDDQEYYSTFTDPLKFAGLGPLAASAVADAYYPLGVQFPGNGIGNLSYVDDEADVSNNNVVPVNLWADMSKATAATINQLRFAFQYQKMLEKDALYGTRYWEILHGHFGVIAPDASLQDPELLGSHRCYINIDQVIQTTGIDQATPSQNELGQVAANSVTGDKCGLVTKSFTEHGFLFILAVARHDQTYGQGVDRMWSRKTRTDHYFPVFANLGSQEIKNKEIFAQGTSADDSNFGYQEAWAEYRYKTSKVTGILNPAAANSLGFWTLANNFASLPSLGQTFIEQNRDNLARALSTGATGPDFIADFMFLDKAIRPMPVYSIPGLIDHH